MVLSDPCNNWGPTPFRFYNLWLEDKSITRAIDNSLRTSNQEDTPGASLKLKLKLSIRGIKEALNRPLSATQVNPHKLELLINAMDIDQEIHLPDEARLRAKLQLRTKLWQAYRLQEARLRQKSRVQWIKLGDSNSKFFHIVAANRRRKNSILRINSKRGRGGVLVKPHDIKGAIFNHFKSHFTPSCTTRPQHNSDGFQKLNNMQREILEKPFSMGEIEAALADCDGNKSPGPDGFTLHFVQSKWDFPHDDFAKFFDDFHRNGKARWGDKFFIHFPYPKEV